MKFWRYEDQISTLLQANYDWLQIQAGMLLSLLERPDKDLLYLKSKWLVSLRNFLACIKGALQLDAVPPVTKQGIGDIFLMEEFLCFGCFPKA